MRWIVAGLCCSALLLCSLELSPSPPAAPLEIQSTDIPGLAVAARTIDVGLLGPNEQAHVAFELINQSHDPLEIDEIVPECGCTAVQLSTRRLAPYETFSLPVTVDARSAGWNRFNKWLRVRFLVGSERERRDLLLSVTGRVDQSRSFRALPGVVDFGTVTAGDAGRVPVEFIGSRSILDALPEQIDCNPGKSIQMTVGYHALSPETATRTVEFVLASGASQDGIVRSEVVLEVDGPERHRLVFPVTARVSAPVEVRPRRVLITDSDRKDATAQLTLTARNGRELAVDDISSDLPLEWTVVPSSARDGLVLQLTWAAGSGPAAPAAGLMRIALKDTDTRVVVPVVRVTQRGRAD